MTIAPASSSPSASTAAFDLERLLAACFAPRRGERIALLIDLADPSEVEGLRFLDRPELELQRLAHDVFYRSLHEGVMDRLGLVGGGLYAYRATGGSNLDLPPDLIASDGARVTFDELGATHDILLCLSTHSATAPLLALARRHDFRAATMHGIDRQILATGLAVDYERVAQETDRFRDGLVGTESVEIDFLVDGTPCQLVVDVAGQRVGTSKGQCRGPEPNVENLPDGEVYFVPKSARGILPMRYEDGTVALLDVEGGSLVGGRAVLGEQATVDAHLAAIRRDPATGVLGELGFGTQPFPYTGRDIQDEKILGTLHLATGRSDHMGGPVAPGSFEDASNATHDDYLYNPRWTPEIEVPQVRLVRDRRTEVLIEHYRPGPYLVKLLGSTDGEGG